jgi:hypothetical protein
MDSVRVDTFSFPHSFRTPYHPRPHRHLLIRKSPNVLQYFEFRFCHVCDNFYLWLFCAGTMTSVCHERGSHISLVIKLEAFSDQFHQAIGLVGG